LSDDLNGLIEGETCEVEHEDVLDGSVEVDAGHGSENTDRYINSKLNSNKKTTAKSVF
jgi:hypothetical protein